MQLSSTDFFVEEVGVYLSPHIFTKLFWEMDAVKTNTELRCHNWAAANASYDLVEVLWKTFLTHKVWETPYAIYEEKFQADEKKALW